jgi:hypothetical protein
MLDRISPYYKAVTAVVVPFLGSLGTALLEDSAGGSAITASEWIAATVLGLVAGGAVFGVPNIPKSEDVE